MKLTLGFSPCPNDTFIFHALLHGLVDTEGLEFEPVMEDVESLNQRAFRNELNITKLSYNAFCRLSNTYQLLNSGSALGTNCGPLLIAKQPIQNLAEKIGKLKIAIPGENTTANFLLGFAFPIAQNKTVMTFSEIESAVLSGEADAGVIIHENRFTYQQKGLVKLLDLGEYWEQKTKFPIPLGGIAMQNSFPEKVIKSVDRSIRRSIEYAFENPAASRDYVRCHSQEMDESVIQQHIHLYVNEFTLDLGTKGQEAVAFMCEKVSGKSNTNLTFAL